MALSSPRRFQLTIIEGRWAVGMPAAFAAQLKPLLGRHLPTLFTNWLPVLHWPMRAAPSLSRLRYLAGHLGQSACSCKSVALGCASERQNERNKHVPQSFQTSCTQAYTLNQNDNPYMSRGTYIYIYICNPASKTFGGSGS